jgi:arginyl-tRNA synthetase
MTHDPLLKSREAAERIMGDAMVKLGVAGAQITFDEPPEGMGDLAFPCFALSKKLRRGPAQIAQELAAAAGKAPEISSISAAGPYVNFAFDDKMLAKATLEAVLDHGASYGSHPPSGKKVLLEHTSANPTDRLSVGRGRNPIIGDTLARIMRTAGYSVETQYYVDDMGRQAAMKTLAVRHGQTYQWAAGAAGEKEGEEGADPALKRELASLVSGAERGDKATIDEMMRVCSDVMQENITPTLRRIGADVDAYISESKFVLDGSVGRVMADLKGSGLPDENGATYIDLERHGISGRSSKYFLSRADGTSLYATRDVAYHLWKLGRCDRAVNVLGEDHKLEAKGVEISLKLLGSEKVPEVLFYSFVSLPEGKMSTRAGRVVMLDDLLDEAEERALAEVAKRRPELTDGKKRDIARAVGVAAVRYNIVRVQAEKPMVFKWEEALNFEGNSAPFVQYAHARASSILAKAGEVPSDYDPSLLAHEMELKLVRRLAAFPSLVAKCAKDMTPHLMASYALLLASDFNQFYRDCPVLVAEGGTKVARLALVKASRLALQSALNVLAIEPLEEM